MHGHFGCCVDWGTGHNDETCPCRPDERGYMTGDGLQANTCHCGKPARENAYGRSCDAWPLCQKAEATP